jgi:hypothetical protein
MKASPEARLLYGTRAALQKLRLSPFLRWFLCSFSGLGRSRDEISAGRRKVVSENGQGARKNREKTAKKLD